MRSLREKIKTSLEKCTALQWQSFGLGLTCFVVMFAVRYKSAWHWDDIAYLKNLIRGLPSDLLLGRPGFMYPFIWLWVAVRKFGASFYLIEDIIRLSNILFLSAAYVFVFRILVILKISVRVAFLTVILMLSEFSFSVISSRVGDSALMYMCVTASYYTFILAHEQKSRKHLFWSSFLFGYSFLVREPALFYFPFFAVTLFYFYGRQKLFALKNYLWGGLITLLTCISAPALMSWYYGNLYTDTLRFSSSKGYTLEFAGLFKKAGIFWYEQFNGILLPLALAGLFIFAVRINRRFLTGLLVAALGPVLITFFFSEEALLMEPRIFMGLFFAMAFGLAYLIDTTSDVITTVPTRIFFLVTAATVCIFVTASRFLPQYRADLAKIDHLENYYESIKPLINKNTVVILGEETLYVAYRGNADGIGPYFVSPGWSWPSGKLVENIRQYLSQNHSVIYDPRSRHYNEAKRAKDLDEMTESFTLTETNNGFFRVTQKN